MQNLLARAFHYLGEPHFRSLLFQVLLISAAVLLIGIGIDNAFSQLAKQNIATGFGFLFDRAGFQVSQALIDYSSDSSYGRALLVGFLNTLLVAALGIFFATVLGFVIGVARISNNRVISSFATAYVETIRNIPLLLQIFFWYFAVFGNFPSPRNSLSFLDSFFINRRGFYMPEPLFEAGMMWVALVFILSLVGLGVLQYKSKQQQEATGHPLPMAKYTLAILLVPVSVAYFLFGQPLSLSYPALQGFNFQGGIRLNPELLALVVALSTYTAAFIAEIVRAGIGAVKRGQVEAGLSLGLARTLVLRKIIIPQALRVIVPPLTSQYLNLTKNSSLAVAIAYPDLVSVFAGTALNQTGQAFEIIFITMSVYLILSLLTSWAMNLYNRHLLQRGGVAPS